MDERADLTVCRSFIEVANQRRESVVRLQRALWQGGLLRLSHERHVLLRKFGLSPAEGEVAVRLSEADDRGCLATTTPLTLEEALVAAGIE